MLDRLKTSLLIGISLVLIIPGSTRATQWAPGEVIVKFRDDVEIHIHREDNIVKTGIPSIDSLHLNYQLASIEKIFTNTLRQTDDRYTTTPAGRAVKIPQLFNLYRLRFPETADVEGIIRVYALSPYVEYAEPNYLARMCVTPNDPMFGSQWGFIKIQAPNAWDIETGDSTVVIGILDTGIDTNHVDLAGNLWVNTDEIPNNGIDDDNNGFVDDVRGWNFVNDTNIVHDGAGHGSHCAGIVAAVTDNNIGVAGTSWDSRLMAVKVLNNNGVGLYSDIAQGINYAANNGVKVLSMSLGGYAYSQMWDDALINAYTTAVPVAAAGNEAVSDSFYPACFDVVLGVAATDSQDIKWDGSNYGNWVDLSSPGVAILSTKLNDTYGLFTGTSEAAPFVSGVAALVASHNPALSTGAVMNMITNNTDPIDTLNPSHIGMLGTGRLNAYAALIGDSLPSLAVHSDTIDDSTGDNDGVPDAGETVNMILVIQNNGGDATGVSAILHTDDIDITITDSTAGFGNILAREKKANSADVYTFTVSDTCPQHGVLFRLYATANGGAYNDTIEFTIATQNMHNVSGVISTNTTWQRGTYVVDGNIIINPAVTLTIEPGAEIRLNPGIGIRIDGTLNAIGIEQDSITFTRSDTATSWGTLLLNPGATANFVFCKIEFAGNSGIRTQDPNCSLYVAHCHVSNNVCSDNWHAAGIHAGAGTIINNIINNNSASSGLSYGGAIYAAWGTTVANNMIYNNTAGAGGGVFTGGGTTVNVSNNVIHDNFASWCGGGVLANGATILDNNLIYNNTYGEGGSVQNNYQYVTMTNNTIIDTHSSAIFYEQNTPGLSPVHNNNIIASNYAVYNSTANIQVDSNWWGTTNTATIDSLIWDFFDNPSLGIVYYQPILTSPSQTAPPYLDSLAVYPEPVGVETLYVHLTFSKSMNTAIAPAVLFAIDDTIFDTLDAYQCTGAWTDMKHWDGWYYINEMVLDSTYRIRVTEAEDDSGFAIPPDQSHTFLVYTAGSAARELFAEPSYNMVYCHWHEAGINNLLGYNLYRSMISGGPYTQLNTTVIPDTIHIDYDVSVGNTYYYTYTILDNNFHESSMSSEASAYVGVDESGTMPAVFALYDISPNPFVGAASLKYAVPKRTHVQLQIYDVQGRLVKTLVDERNEPGYYTASWDGTDYYNRSVASGVYFYRFLSDGLESVKKLILLR